MSDDDYKPLRPGSNPSLERALLDSKLRAYLEEHEADKAEGNTIANIRLELHQFQLVQQEQGHDIQLLKLRVDRHGAAIRQIKTHLSSNTDGFEHDTGVHQVEDLRKHLAAKEAELKERDQERKSDATWLKRKKADIAIAAIGFGIASVISSLGVVLWYLLTHGVK